MGRPGAKRLPCNHIFHVSCLRSWFQRQQTCPTCRLNVLRVAPPTPPRNFVPFNQFGFPQAPQRAPDVAPPQPPFGVGTWGGVRPWINQPGQPVPVNSESGSSNNTSQPPAAASGVQGSQISSGFSFIPPPFSHPQMNFRFDSSSGESASTQTNPFNIPPLPFIPLVPAPPPLQNVTGLSYEELTRLEGTTREHLEARLECLRDIQILLDSAVVQMQQYSAVSSKINRSKDDAVPSTSRSVHHFGTDQFEKLKADELNSSTEQLPLNVSLAKYSPALSEQEEVRKRRLEKFSNNTTEKS